MIDYRSSPRLWLESKRRRPERGSSRGAGERKTTVLGPSRSGDTADEIWLRLEAASLVAILRAPTAARVREVAICLVESGIDCLEVTMTTEGALGAISDLVRELPAEALVGAGTVMDVREAEAAIDAGASFLVSPATCGSVIEWSAARDVLHIPAALTPSEILAATDAGARAVKIFPASALGGPSYIKALREPLPDCALVPTGGVGLDEIGSYLSAGASAVGLGGQLIGDALLPGGNLDELSARAKKARDATEKR